jgi:hypothetical protein
MVTDTPSQILPDATEQERREAEIARQQWLAQIPLIKRSERRAYTAMRKAYIGAVDRLVNTGAVMIPQEAQVDVAQALVRMWGDSIRLGMSFPSMSEKAAFPHLERKNDEQTLFEQLQQAFLDAYGADHVRLINEVTRKQVQRALDRGIQEGLGIEEIAKQIRASIPSFSRLRANAIARTEVHNAAMFASREVARTSVFPLNKRWVSVYDARTRDFGEGDGEVDSANHRAMNGVTVGPDELFQVPRRDGFMVSTDLMNGPGDPSAPPDQTINCRCALTYRRAGR